MINLLLSLAISTDVVCFVPDRNAIKPFVRYEVEEISQLTYSLAQSIVDFEVDPAHLQIAINEYLAFISDQGGFEDEGEGLQA